MNAVPAARLWLLVGLLLSVTLGLHQLLLRSGLQAGIVEGRDLDGQATVLRDPTARLDIEEVVAARAAGRFGRPDNADMVFGYTRDAIWIHLPLPAEGERYLEVRPPRLVDVRLYLRGPDGRFHEHRAGLAVPLAQRAVHARPSVFVLPGRDRADDAYVRIASGNAILVDLRLWEPVRFLEAARHVDLLNGLQFGALLLFALYAFATAAALREGTHAWFGVTLLSYALYDISILQYGYQYLWPANPDWSVRGTGVFLASAVFGLGQLVAGLLQTHLYMPRWNLALRGLGVVALAYIPGMVAGDYAAWVQWLNYIALLQLGLTILVTLQAVFRGQPGAMLLLAAFLLLWFTSLLRMAQILGILPHSLLADFSQGWAMVVGGLLMAMTQAERLRRANAEREVARQALVTAQTSAREEAERAVAERTRELMVARDAAEASSRAKSAFLTQLSHELRTPLHSILGYSGLMRGDTSDPEAQRRLDAIRRSGQHLLTLIDSLLDYARGEAGRLQLELQPLRLRPFLDSVAEETAALVESTGMRLDLEVAEDVPDAFRLDATRLRQVLANLIVNAVRHSHGRRILLSARLEPQRAGCCLRLAVCDDGVGIPPADRERIFRPFEQGGEGSAAAKGMGLGLAISRQIVALMGGELVLEPGTPGSCFVIRLLAERVEAMAAEPPLPVPGRVAGPIRRILVVDDDSDGRYLLVEQLAGLGFAAEAVPDAAAALQRLREAPAPDLVLTDERMPGATGAALLAAARQEGRGMPFVLASASPPVTPGDSGGFAAVLQKPVSADQLAASIGRVLGLAWQPPVDNRPATARASPDSYSPPSRERLAELRRAAEEGRISDIEDWLAALQRSDPGAAGFANAVQNALRRLDLEAIRRMTD